MRFLSPVVWHEGMHLAQHHFQAQARYHEDLAAFVLSELFFAAYGAAAYEFDAEALRNDTLSLVHARGLMPDGLVFHFPEDPLPEPREIRSLFSPTQDSHMVLLAIPALQPGRANCAVEPGGARDGALRFSGSARSVVDDSAGSGEKPVIVARKNFRLLLDVEDASGLVTLPLARVRRDGTGRFVFDEAYVPPCVQIGASPRLMSLLRRLVETLEARNDSLAAERDGASEAVSHWLSHALSSSLGPLSHLFRSRRAHPEVLFTEMLRLAGALCTFSMTANPRELPLYDHDHLDLCFGTLDRQIRGLLDVIVPQSSIRIPLRPQAESFFTASVTDPRCLASSQWFLGVRAGATPTEIASRVPRLVKVCSARFIERLAREAIPGLVLEHAPSPPPQISPRAGMEYFVIPRSGPCWLSIVETCEVGIYAPAAIPNAELELVVAIDP